MGRLGNLSMLFKYNGKTLSITPMMIEYYVDSDDGYVVSDDPSSEYWNALNTAVMSEGLWTKEERDALDVMSHAEFSALFHRLEQSA